MILKYSYFKNILRLTKMLAIPSVTFALLSCNGESGKLNDSGNGNAADIYRVFLSEIRSEHDLTFEELAALLEQWEAITDSALTFSHQDTTHRVHTETFRETIMLRDSICSEFSRLAVSKERSYNEILDLKERFTPYGEDEELHLSVEKIRPFFDSLDNQKPYRGDKGQVLSAYRTLLTRTLEKGIHSRKDLTEFIRKEDAVFRAFLNILHDLGETVMTDISNDTGKCCSEIFYAAEREEISYKEAMIYMTLRTNRRVIQNARSCLDDTRRGYVNNASQAHVYVWMILHPYISLNGLCMDMLSEKERKELDRIAMDTPEAFEVLCRLLPSQNARLDELPGMLMGIIIESMLNGQQ